MVSSNQCNCPRGSYSVKHTSECYEAQIERLVARLATWQASCTGKHGSQMSCVGSNTLETAESFTQRDAEAMANVAIALDRDAFKARLNNVAAWLENGCDPIHAAQELRSMTRPSDLKADVCGICHQPIHRGHLPWCRCAEKTTWTQEDIDEGRRRGEELHRRMTSQEKTSERCDCPTLARRGEKGNPEIYCPKCGKVFREPDPR